MNQEPKQESGRDAGDPRREGNVVDQRQQQIDPAGKNREKPDEPGPHRSQKQPGQDLGEASSGDP